MPTVTPIKFIEKDFKTEYSPFHEWLLLVAYTLLTTTSEPDKAREVVALLQEEDEIVTQLIIDLSIYQNRIEFYLISVHHVEPAIAKEHAENVHHIFRKMMEYYDQIYKKVELYDEHLFFNQFECLVPEATNQFATLIWGDPNPKNCSFAKYMILEYYLKNKLPFPIDISKFSSKEYLLEDVRREIIGMLLLYFVKEKKNPWASSLLVADCKHTRVVLEGNDFICDQCGKFQDSMDDYDDHTWSSIYDDEFDYYGSGIN